MSRTRRRVAIIAASVLVPVVAQSSASGEVVEAVPPTPAVDLEYEVVDGAAVITGCGDHDCRNGLIIPESIVHQSNPIPVTGIADFAFEHPDIPRDPDDDDYDEAVAKVIVGDVVIPDSVVTIGEGAFVDQRGITSVSIGDGVVDIAASAFEDARALTGLSLGESVQSIGADAFINAGIVTLVVPDSVLSIGDAAFRGNDISSLALGNGLQTIGDYAFNGNFLASVDLPDSLTTIGGYGFSSNDLTVVEFGSAMSVVGYGAFSSNDFASVTLPASITAVGGDAFGYMLTLTEFVLDGPPPTTSGDVFTNSPNLTAVTVRPGLGYGATWGGVPTVVVARAPSAPTGVVGAAGDGRATVTWTAPASSDATVTGYEVTATPGGQQCVWTQGPLTCDVSGLSNGTSYTFTVTATSTAGTSVSSAASAAVTPAAATTTTLAAVTSTVPAESTTTTSTAASTTPVETTVASTSSVVTTTAVATTLAVGDRSVGVASAPSIETIRSLPEADLAGPVAVGADFDVAMGGFRPGEQVLLVVASTPQVIAETVADPDGWVSFSGRLPADVGAGPHTLAVYAPGSGVGARQSIEVDSGELPSTGSTESAAVALLALALGGLVVTAMPRRRTA
jgi:hypothetical protein